MHASCDYDIVGLSPGCTSFPFCLSSTLVSLFSVLCFINEEGIQEKEVNLKCVLTVGLGFPTPCCYTEDL